MITKMYIWAFRNEKKTIAGILNRVNTNTHLEFFIEILNKGLKVSI
ncbi:hypothetical protein ES705_09830 [subsurface metagenome]